MCELSSTLAPISEKQVQWAFRNCLEQVGRRTKSGVITCLHCGEQWVDKSEVKTCHCPHCGTKLNIQTTQK